MKIQNKIRGLLLVLVIVFALGSFFIQKYTVYSKFVDIEYHQAEDDVMRSIAAIKREELAVAKLLEDWGTWNDTYEFVKDRNQKFVAATLLNETYAVTGLNLIYIINTKGDVIWGKTIKNGEEIKMPEFPLTPWNPDSVLLPGTRSHKIISGIVYTQLQPMIICAGRIIKSDCSGKSRGTIIMGKFIDKNVLDRLFDQTKVRFELYVLNESMLSERDTEVANNLEANTPYVSMDEKAGMLYAYYILPDLKGVRSFMIKAKVPMKHTIVGAEAMRLSMMLWFIIGVVMLFVFSCFIRRNVVSPILSIGNYARGINGDMDLSARLKIKGTGEISELAGELNNMMVRLENDRAMRVEAENQLRMSRERYRHMLMTLPVGVYRHSKAERPEFSLMNEAFLRIFGCETVEEFKYNSKLSGWSESPRYKDFLDNPMRSGGLDFELTDRAENSIFVKIWVNIIEHDGEDVVEGILLNFTDQKRAEDDICRLATMVAQAEEIIMVTDLDGKMFYINPAFEKITGYTLSEVMNRQPQDFSGDRLEEPKYKEIWEHLQSGSSWTGSLVFARKTGEVFTIKGTIFPVFNEGGRATCYAGILRDITHEQKLEQQLRQSHKMEAIGTLAGGIAHDFNNILSAILGYANLAVKEVESDPAQTERYIRKIAVAGNRARDLVSQILAFSRQKQLKEDAVQFGTVVKEACNLLRASLPSSIEIRRYIKSKSMVAADPTQLHQIMLNLCTNASHSMDGYGVLTVTLEDAYVTEREAEELPGLSCGRYVCLKVEDTGHGMDEITQKRVFEPFFTTKDLGEGTGMGLSVVHGIVSSLGGAINIRSRINEGSSFTVYLPVLDLDVRTETSTPVKIENDDDKQKLSGNERILFVDDEKILVELNKEALEAYGYKVTGISDSTQALKLFQSSPDDFDVVVSDLTMPGMTGDVLVEEIKKIRPDIPVVICTGYNNVTSEERITNIGVCIVVHKPIVGRQLAETIRTIMSGD
ncbi:MAG: PAS domain S-box protein [Victivallales bacterium]|nr:PAS domain S-box protein [Victivallales bacterium]